MKASDQLGQAGIGVADSWPMGSHLYVCEGGGPMTLAIEGTPPKWVTCPIGAKALECASCPGAYLKGDAPPFPVAAKILYRCAAGHVRTIMLRAGDRQPESAQCPECEGMLLPACGT